MRFTRAKKAWDPDADTIGYGWVSDVGTVGVEKVAKVTLQLVGHYVFFKLLIYGVVIRLVGFNYAIDRAIQWLQEQLFDAHAYHP